MYGRSHTRYQALLSAINALIEQHETIVSCSSPLVLTLPKAEALECNPACCADPQTKKKIIFGATSEL